MRFILFVLFYLIFTSCIESNQKKNIDKQKIDTFSIDTEKIIEVKIISENYLCEGFLLDSNIVLIYDSINGNIIDSVSNNYELEEFNSISIYEQRNNWFKIKIQSIEDETMGWIKQEADIIGVYAANYTGELNLFSTNSKNSSIIHVFTSYFTEPMIIVGCSPDWVKIKLFKDEKLYEGWVMKSQTCPSPYTTCN